MRLVLALTVLAACGGARKTPTTGPAKPAEAADPRGAHEVGVAASVQPLIDAEIVKAIVVGIYDAGTTEIYGFGEGPGGKPPTGRTLFEIGSITKVYTSLLLADSVQRREVDLDQPVAELLPPGVTAPTREDKVITLRELAVHSSGLPRLPPSMRTSSAPDPYAKYDENQLYADLVQTQLESTPGTAITYSNYGAGLLGFLLGKKIGGGYDKVLQARILAPLGMTDTMLHVGPADAARFAQGTNDDLAPVSHWTFDALAPAGALVSNARDQLKLLDAELDAAAGGKTLPLRRAMALTQEPQIQDADSNAGLGWQIDRDGLYWHNGGTGGFHSFIAFDPKTRRGVVILASTSTSVVDGLSHKLLKVLAGEKLKQPTVLTAAELAPYAGTYDFAGQAFAVIAAGKRLYVQGPGEPKERLIPVGDRTFWLESVQALVLFERDGDKVSRAVIMIGDKRIAAPRKE